jgi:hypothetical protein
LGSRTTSILKKGDKMADNRTLDEIGEGHVDNFEHVLSHCENKVFPSAVYAYEYRMHCIEKAYQTLGFSPQDLITNSTSMDVAVELIDQALVSRDILTEDWAEHEEPPKRGLYIYHAGEIAFFIALVRKSGDNYIVKSNVKF